MNPIFCGEIFGVIMTLTFLSPCCCSEVQWDTNMVIPYIFTKNVSSRSPITLKQNALALQNLAQMCNFKLCKSINIFQSKSFFLILMNFDMTRVQTKNMERNMKR